MARNDHIQFLLDLAQDAWRVYTGEIPVDVLVHDFYERQKLCQ